MPRGPKLYWIREPFGRRLAVSARPQGYEELEEDVLGWRESGVGAVVSMMEPEEAEELGLAAEGEVCRQNGIEFISCPVSDHGVPDDFDSLLRGVDQALGLLGESKRVVAHCFAGIGRSPLFVACALVRHGLDVDLAWDRIIAARGLQLPDNDSQWQWVAEFADRARDIRGG